MWCKRVVGLGYEQFKNCKHCGMDYEYYYDEQNKINKDFILGKVSIEKQKKDLAELEKCLTRKEAVVKDILT